MTEQLETAKAKQAEIVNAKNEETQFEREIAQKRIAELEEKLVDLEDDYEGANELVNTLTISERQANDEVADAKTTILDSEVSVIILKDPFDITRCFSPATLGLH